MISPREAYEKRKAEGRPKASAFAPKDWATLSLSVFALIVSISSLTISGANFYFGSIRQTEQVSVFFERLPTFAISKTTPRQLEISNQLVVVYINSGTRPAAVVGATLYLQETSTLESMERVDWCTKREKNRRVYRSTKLVFDSFVIKEKEIARKALAIQGPSGNKLSFPVPSWVKGLDNVDDTGYWVNPCIEFKLTTPSSIVAGEAVELPTMYRFTKEGKVEVDDDVDSSTPFQIWKSSGTVLD